MVFIAIIFIAFVLCFVYRCIKTQKGTRESTNTDGAFRERIHADAEDAVARRHRMVDDPQFPFVGGCRECTFRNYSECEKFGYNSSKVCYCEKFNRFVDIVDNCEDFIHEGNTLGMQDFVNAFKDI